MLTPGVSQDFDIPKWWGITDQDDEELTWADGDLGGSSLEDRDLFCFEVDEEADDVANNSELQSLT